MLLSSVKYCSLRARLGELHGHSLLVGDDDDDDDSNNNNNNKRVALTPTMERLESSRPPFKRISSLHRRQTRPGASRVDLASEFLQLSRARK